MCEVAILMSTYNGQEYLKQQLKSIQDQSFANWRLYIRDDGSNDQTRQIINKYAVKDSRITFLEKISNENLGPQASFFALLKRVDAQYYMFSDQDDVWKKDKIAKTLRTMKNAEEQYGDIPLNVFTNLSIVDSNLNQLELMNKSKLKLSFLSLLFHNVITGCTMMINQPLKAKLNFELTDYQNSLMHDWWLGLVAAIFGKNVYLNEPTILYRQHGDNTVGMNAHNSLKRILKRISNLSKEIATVLKVEHLAIEVKKQYLAALNVEEKQYILGYADLAEKSSIVYNFNLSRKCPPKREHSLFFTLIMIRYAKQLRIYKDWYRRIRYAKKRSFTSY